MSAILYRELRSTYYWLKTYIPWRFAWKRPVMSRLLRKGYRAQMKDNRVWASFCNWLGGRNVD